MNPISSSHRTPVANHQERNAVQHNQQAPKNVQTEKMSAKQVENIAKNPNVGHKIDLNF
jgi:hypothetical protein